VRTNGDPCSEWRALASCRLDGELDELQTARLERHLAVCAECANWANDVSALAGLLHETEPVGPAWAFEYRAGALRRRFVRAAVVSATAASAAAVAAFGIVLPGNGLGISIFSSSSAHAAAPLPSASQTKKQALTFGTPARAAAPVHVANPLFEQN
jgi:predicted anti-sigma-YlaC factor YlaD